MNQCSKTDTKTNAKNSENPYKLRPFYKLGELARNAGRHRSTMKKMLKEWGIQPRKSGHATVYYLSDIFVADPEFVKSMLLMAGVVLRDLPGDVASVVGDGESRKA